MFNLLLNLTSHSKRPELDLAEAFLLMLDIPLLLLLLP